jgi:ParB-like chromosome segregation protein Spo0J
MNYIPHEIANLFPLMSGEEFVALKADIKENGLKNPVILLDGKILDGRNRFKACQEVGVKAITQDYDGNDPLADVISWNLKRRHLNETQRASVAAKLANMRQGERTDMEPSANLRKVSQTQAADMLNVSERSVTTAKKVQEAAIPEITEKMSSGEISLNSAALAASLPEEEQKEIITKINQGEKPTKAIKQHIEAKEPVITHSTALQFSSIAISQLSRIKQDDVKRVEALNIVLEYINKQLSEKK